MIDWFGRCVLAWELSNTMEVASRLAALNNALARGRPGIFNVEQFRGALKVSGTAGFTPTQAPAGAAKPSAS